MAHSAQQYQFQPLPADSHGTPNAFDFDDGSTAALLDPALLESDMLQHPSVARFRKDSFANPEGILSPADSNAWDAHQFHDMPRSTFKTEDQFRPPMQAHNDHGPAQHWSMPVHSGSATPNAGFELMPAAPHFDNMQYMPMKQESRFDHRQQRLQAAEPRLLSAPQVQTPISAHGPTDWMAMAEAESRQRSLPKRLRSDSPGRSAYDLFPRDGGITKKNKRIDIPLERNLQNIDHLIETTKDEEVLKELKAQKRLLRNREAALASRQRKKKHTEELENKEKGHQTTVSMLEQQVEVLAGERIELDQQRQILMHRNDELQRFIEVLQMEKRDMMMKHNEETASLRRKVQVLSEQLETGPQVMSAAPSSTGFTDFNAEMEALNMNHDWDNFLFMPGPSDSTTDLDISTPKTEMAKSITLDKAPTQPSKTPDQPIASGLLFMLLLCGAFVATKPASTLEVDIPADVRAVAPTVLDNLLSESSNNKQPRAQSLVPRAVPMTQPVRGARSANRLRQMHRSLTAPTRQQRFDTAFALTPSQYASLTSDPEMPRQDDTIPRRTLAQALAETQGTFTESKAEIYTRSLLWEQIPEDVVNRFRELVKDHHDITTQHDGR